MVIRACEPQVVEAAVGWLATTPPDHPYRIGVTAPTEEEARRRFEAAMVAWRELRERSERTS